MNESKAYQQTEQLATEFVSVLAKLSPRETDALMSQFWLTVASKLHGMNPSTDLQYWSRIHQKTPVPAEVVQQALREFDDKSTIEELDRIRETGGFKFDDFYGELELLVRSPESSS